MTNEEIAEKFISDLHNAEQNGGTLHVPDCIIDWKELEDGSYIIKFEEKPCKKLKETWNKFLDELAVELHLHDILDWIDKKLGN